MKFSAIIQIAGKPKEHVEETAKSYVEKIIKDELFKVLKHELAEIEEKDEIFYTHIDVEIEADKNNLLDFCFIYMPSAIDILEPETIEFKDIDLTNLFNDLQGNLFQLDGMIKQLRTKNDFLNKNTFNLLKNYISLLLSKASLNLENLSKLTGVTEKEMDKVLEKMEDLDLIEKEGELFKLKNGIKKSS